MANQSIFAAFERMWQHVVVAISDAVAAEQTRAEGIEAGLRTDVDNIKDNALYGVDTNKDGNVELLFGIKTITFTITDGYGVGAPFDEQGAILTFQAEEGMTWAEWITSDYCTIRDYIFVDEDYGNEVMISGYWIYDDNGDPVADNSPIIADYQYAVSA